MTTTARYETVQAFDMTIDNGGEKTPFVLVSLRVVDGPNVGTNLFWRGYLSEAAAPYTLANMRKLGWSGTKISRAMAEGLGSMKARAQLKTAVWAIADGGDGKAREKVNGFYAIGESKLKTDNPVEQSDLDAFDVMLQGAAEAIECTPVTDIAKAGPLPPAAKRATAPSAGANPNDLGF
jgi:hypothetical protein